MATDPPAFATAHPIFAYWLDETLKIGALAIGAAWTFWNFLRSRPFALKPAIEIAGNHFVEAGNIYIAITATLENLGAASLVLDEDGTYCELLAVYADLSTQSLRLFEMFTLHDSAESGESIDDRLVWRIENLTPDIVWLRIDLRVQSGTIEWNTSAYERILRDGIAKKA